MGKAITITRMDHTAVELRAFAARNGDGAQVRRFLARWLKSLRVGLGRRLRGSLGWIARGCVTGCIATIPMVSRG